jgi:vacuolar-type H+-ATPase subunit D/Vma8
MNLKETSQELIGLRQQINELDDAHKLVVAPLKEKKDKLQTEIMESLKESGQYSARFEHGTVSRAVKKTLKVVDEKVVIAHLKQLGVGDEYTSVQLNDLFKNSFSKAVVKSGEVINGTEITETEYISISKPSNKEDKRKVKTDDYSEKTTKRE